MNHAIDLYFEYINTLFCFTIGNACKQVHLHCHLTITEIQNRQIGFSMQKLTLCVVWS